MKPKLKLSVSEMMQLRNDGYSNKDIARILDISLPTVYKYIGKQGCHIPSATASFVSKPKPDTPPPQPPQITVVSRVVSIDGYLFELSNLNSAISVSLANGQSITIHADEVDALIYAFGMAKEYMANNKE
jgi:hypothetical protein